MFYDDGIGAERTEHKHIAPARERIKQYRVRRIPNRTGLSAISQHAMPPRPPGMRAAKSTTNLATKGALAAAGRPITAGVGSSVATAAFTGAEDATSGVQAAMNARAISVSRFTNFSEQERAVKKHPFPSFSVKQDAFQKIESDEQAIEFKGEYEKTDYHRENRFGGKGNYMHHASTGLVVEQELEKFFRDAAHKDLQDKRANEEGTEMMREWGMARGRVEAEIQRRKEHKVDGSNFQKARGWVR